MKRIVALVVLTMLTGSPVADSIASRIDPADWTRDTDDEVLYGAAVRELSSDDAGLRAEAASYLDALVRRLLSDSRRGSCEDEYSVYGKRPANPLDARQKLQALAERIAGTSSREAFSVARLLLEHGRIYDPHDGDELDVEGEGLAMLSAMDDASVEPLLGSLLGPPHGSREVVLGAIEMVRKRKLTSLRDEVAALTQDYRPDVRSRAALVAVELGGSAPAPFDSRRMLALYDSELRELAAMVATQIPDDAKWVHVRWAPGRRVFSIHDAASWSEGAAPDALSGWLVSDSDSELRVVDFVGVERAIAKAGATVESRTLAGEVGAAAQNLVVPAGLLPGVWAWMRGDADTAAALLMMSYFATDDRRSVRRQFVSHLGRAAQERLVRAFSFSADFPEAARLGRLLASDLFDGYWYQPCAGTLAEQIASTPPRTERMTTEDWRRFAATSDKPRQIERLVALMPAVRPPVGRAGTSEFSLAELRSGSAAEAVFDPRAVLSQLAKDFSDIPALARHLDDETFVPEAVYPLFSRREWMEVPGAPKRVNEILASQISMIAKQDIVRIDEFRRLDADGKRRRIDEIVAWAGGQGALSEADRELATLETSWTDRPARMTALHSLTKRGDRRVVPFLLRQAEEEPQYRSVQLEPLYRLDDPRAVPAVRSWLAALPREAVQDSRRGDAFSDRQLRVYGGLILLRHGDRARLEGLDEIRKVLALDRSGYFSAIASDELRSLGRPDVVSLLEDNLSDPKFCDPPRDCVPALCRLIVAGKREALDLLRTVLEDGTPNTKSPNGVHYATPKGDQMADEFSRLRPGGWIHLGTPATEMAEKRRDLSDWVSAQFDLIVAGKPSELDCNRTFGQTAGRPPTLPPVP